MPFAVLPNPRALTLWSNVSMSIYISTKAMPYVYMCVHKITGEFYIGYRVKNVKLNKPSHIDFPDYRTSSKIVNSNFDNFTWVILAEFYNETDAYDFEQYLIYQHWNDPLLINESCHFNGSRFRNPGGIPCSDEKKRKIGAANKIKLTGITRSEEFKIKISKATKGRKHSQEAKDKLSKIVTEEHKKNPRKWSEESKLKLSVTNKGKKISEEQKKKISDAERLRDKERPISEETKRKISETLKGRPSPLKGRKKS